MILLILMILTIIFCFWFSVYDWQHNILWWFFIIMLMTYFRFPCIFFLFSFDLCWTLLYETFFTLYLFTIFNFLVNNITNTIFFVSWFRYWRSKLVDDIFYLFFSFPFANIFKFTILNWRINKLPPPLFWSFFYLNLNDCKFWMAVITINYHLWLC
jgi:hypothetical protein